MKKSLDSSVVWQIGIVVPDAKKAAEKASQIFGIELNREGAFGRIGGYEHCNTKYYGEDTDGSGYGYCFIMGSVEVEFIQPIGDGPSSWRDFLNTHPNGGVHHLAWKVKDSDKTTELLKEYGVVKKQEGWWETGRYTYYDAKELGIIMEALEFFDDKK
jgi:methylmalonyl-CoA/ethylmalonyl-CoA epimerase